MNQKNPYEILGVPREASQEEIKRVYRQRAKELHPDRNPGNKSAEQQFKEVQAAYEVLGDPERRAQYDRFGAGGPRPDFANWTTGAGSPFQGVGFDFDSIGDLSSIFEQFFQRPRARPRGRRARRAAPSRGADIEHTIELTFEEAARGTTREVRLQAAGPNAHSERIEFRVPAGVADDQRIRVRGRGQEGRGGRGDLMIRCRIRPHPYFRREGNDILLDLPLTFTEAARGAKIDIPTLDGATRLTIPPGTSSGARLRLRGKGIQPPDGAAGDQIVDVQVVAPKSLNETQQRILEQLRDALDQDPREQVRWRTATS